MKSKFLIFPTNAFAIAFINYSNAMLNSHNKDNNNVPTHQVSFHSIWSDEEPEVNYTFNCWKKPQPLKVTDNMKLL